MSRGLVSTALVLMMGTLAAPVSGGQKTEVRDQLAAARQMYNERRFDAALTAAEGARTVERADSVDLVIARIWLELFREDGQVGHLTKARERFTRIQPARLTENERLELLVGLGQQLYLEGAAGAAAALFDTLFDRSPPLVGTARERVLGWWASALDLEARPRPDIDRQGLYQRVRDRMRAELSRNPGSAPAAYWLSAAAAGQGDHQAAWDAALAAWVRAPLSADQTGLRNDLDLLVVRVIVPQRARWLAQPVDVMRAEWDGFKALWTNSESD
jgi:hypothetical protein